MVKTRSGARGSPKIFKRKSTSKTITKESPKKRLLSMNNFNKVVLNFGERLSLPMSLIKQARNIMIGNHERLYLKS